MNARDQLLGTLVKLHGWHPNEANMLIDNFAHELAEHLRQQCKCGGMGRCYCPCADLIDPEVQRATTSKEPTS